MPMSLLIYELSLMRLLIKEIIFFPPIHFLRNPPLIVTQICAY